MRVIVQLVFKLGYFWDQREALKNYARKMEVNQRVPGKLGLNLVELKCVETSVSSKHRVVPFLPRLLSYKWKSIYTTEQANIGRAERWKEEEKLPRDLRTWGNDTAVSLWVSLLLPIYPWKSNPKPSNPELPTGTNKQTKNLQEKAIPIARGPGENWPNNRKSFQKFLPKSSQTQQKNHTVPEVWSGNVASPPSCCPTEASSLLWFPSPVSEQRVHVPSLPGRTRLCSHSPAGWCLQTESRAEYRAHPLPAWQMQATLWFLPLPGKSWWSEQERDLQSPILQK